MIPVLRLINTKSIDFSDYSTFAIIKISTRGHRHLLYDGFRFGQTRTSSDDECVWRCTSTVNKQRKRCNATLYTKIIDGYEMINSTKMNKKCIHEHEI